MFCLFTLSKVSQMEQKTLSELHSVSRNFACRSPETTIKTILAVLKGFLINEIYYTTTYYKVAVCMVHVSMFICY